MSIDYTSSSSNIDQFETMINNFQPNKLSEIDEISNVGNAALENLSKGMMSGTFDRQPFSQRIIKCRDLNQKLDNVFNKAVDASKRGVFWKFFAKYFGINLNPTEKTLRTLSHLFKLESSRLEAQVKLNNKTDSSKKSKSEESAPADIPTTKSTTSSSPNKTSSSHTGDPKTSAPSLQYDLKKSPKVESLIPIILPKGNGPKMLDGNEYTKEGFHRVAVKQEIQSNSLEGSLQSQSLKTVQWDVEKFAESARDLLSPADHAKLQSVTDQLNAAGQIAKKLEELSHKKPIEPTPSPTKWDFHLRKKPPVKQPLDPLKQIALEVRSGITALKEGEEMLVPGGYSFKQDNGIGGHSVLYSFKKENGQFSFTIFNPGHGSEKFSNKWGSLKQSLSNKTNDITFSELTLADLSEDNLRQLLAQNIPSTGPVPHSMETLHKTIMDIVGKREAIAGRSHDVQINGTCNHSSLCCWLETKLSLPNTDLSLLAKTLNLYMARSGVEYLKEGAKVTGKRHTIENRTEQSKMSPGNKTKDTHAYLKEVGIKYTKLCAEELETSTLKHSQRIKKQKAIAQNNLNKDQETIDKAAITELGVFQAETNLQVATNALKRKTKPNLTQASSSSFSFFSSKTKTPIADALDNATATWKQKSKENEAAQEQYKIAVLNKDNIIKELANLDEEQRKIDNFKSLKERLSIK